MENESMNTDRDFGWWVVDKSNAMEIIDGPFADRDEAESVASEHIDWWPTHGSRESIKQNDIEEWLLRQIEPAFKIGFCQQCGPVVVCPRCGMTACTGGYGELEDGTKCNICPVAYTLQYAITRYAEGIDGCAREIRTGTSADLLDEEKSSSSPTVTTDESEPV